MGEIREKDLNCTGVIKLMGICAELNLIFREKGVNMSKGMALVLEEGAGEDLLENLARAIDAVELTKLKSGKNMVRNYQMALHLYTRSDKADEIHGFMHSRNFLPVVIVVGVMPESLREISFGIRADKKIITGIREQEFAKEQKEIKKFVRTNPDLVVRELDMLWTSVDFSRRKEYSSLYTSLLAASKIYRLFYRSFHSESDTVAHFEKVRKEVERCVDEADELAEDCDAMDAIRVAVCRYFGLSRRWHIGDIRNISGDLYKAVKSENAVLYDEEFYYISESLLRRACGTILNVLSFLKVKNILRKEGVIVCNDNAARNFTVKKVINCAHGDISRERFIKMRREFLMSNEGLYLEEMRGSENIVYRESRGEYLSDKR